MGQLGSASPNPSPSPRTRPRPHKPVPVRPWLEALTGNTSLRALVGAFTGIDGEAGAVGPWAVRDALLSASDAPTEK